jgi:hypothetical protein
MQLLRVRLVGVGPFDDLTLPFCVGGQAANAPAAPPTSAGAPGGHTVGEDGTPKGTVVVFGGEGLGKTSLLGAIAATRPGHCVPIAAATSRPTYAVAEWHMGDDDPGRPHALRMVSPNASLEEREDEALLRRREQMLFDRRASEGGFVCVSFSGARWFSRAPLVLSSPKSTVLRWDVRGGASFDDATRADLARDTKQVLAYASVAGALTLTRKPALDGGVGGLLEPPGALLDAGVRQVLAVVLEPFGALYLGADPTSLEPMFRHKGRDVTFDELPRAARQLTAIATLTLRAALAAYPKRPPRDSEGVALVDDLETQLDLPIQRIAVSLLRRALPRVQWIATTASPAVLEGLGADEVVALRRGGDREPIEVFTGGDAVLH